jgi:hypothetical protein
VSVLKKRTGLTDVAADEMEEWSLIKVRTSAEDRDLSLAG